MNAPGSPSSALQITYFFAPCDFATVLHFSPVGKPAPPAAQTAFHDRVDEVFRRHFVQRLMQSLVTVRREVAFDPFGIHDAAVGEDDGQLFLEKRRVGIGLRDVV